MKIYRISLDGLVSELDKQEVNEQEVEGIEGIEGVERIEEVEGVEENSLPFVHFTVLKVAYKNQVEHSTEVEDNFRLNGVKENTSAVEIDPGNIKGSLNDCFNYFYHHAQRINRENTSRSKIGIPSYTQPGIVIVQNVGQKKDDPKLSVDNPGHVWLGSTGAETILAVVPLDLNFKDKKPYKSKAFDDSTFNAFTKKQQEMGNIKQRFIDAYMQFV